MTRERVLRLVAVAALVAAAFAAGALLFRTKGAPAQQASAERRILYYRSPMNPQVTSPTPKKDEMGMDYVPVYADEAGAGRRILYYRDPMNPQVTSPTPKKDEMGMDYVPVYADEAGAGPPPGAGPGAVRIDPRVAQETGVTVEPAEVRQLSRSIRTVGIVRPDERHIYSITVKFAGWVERLFVNFTGDRVKQGDPLAAVYSPELLATQREYLLALRCSRSYFGKVLTDESCFESRKLARSARQRLLLWDIPEKEIRALARRGKPTKLMTFYSPSDGVVLEKQITAGSQIQPGMTLLRIADLQEVWIFAQIYPHQLPWISEGQAAEITVPGLPGQKLQGIVNYIQPVVAAETRTVELRIQVSQPCDGAILLRPEMYANVVIVSPARQAVAIAEQAVIRSGERNVAIVSLGNGYFEPREVVLGASGGGYVEILAGIKQGEQVVTSSQFLIDSESNLRAALGTMGGAPGHAGHGAGPSIGGSGAAQPGTEEQKPGPQPEGQQPAPAPPQTQPPAPGGAAPLGGEHGGHGGHGGH